MSFPNSFIPFVTKTPHYESIINCDRRQNPNKCLKLMNSKQAGPRLDCLPLIKAINRFRGLFVAKKSHSQSNYCNPSSP